MCKKYCFVLGIMLCISLCHCSCEPKDKEKSKTNTLELFELVWTNINEQFYDENFNGADWEQIHKQYKLKVEACHQSDSLFVILNEMLFELNSSHCGVGLISDMDQVVSPYIFGKAGLGIDIRIVDKQILIIAVEKDSPADSSGVKTGYIIESIDGKSLANIESDVLYQPPFNERNKKFYLTTAVLRKMHGLEGEQVELKLRDENDQIHSIKLRKKARQNPVILSAGMPEAFLESKAGRLTEDISYLSFNAFRPDGLEHVLEQLDSLYESKALIIDLRGNDGGSIEAMKLLLSRFVSTREKYGSYINRYEQNDDYIEAHKDKYQGELVVLVDEMSISGAENMAGIVQYLSLGKVIGNPTPGQMLWGSGALLNDSTVMVLPIYKMEYPNGYNPENNGIKPDIEIAYNKSDLLYGIDTQLETAIKYLNQQINKNMN